MKDELVEQIINVFAESGAKPNSSLKDSNDEDKK